MIQIVEFKERYGRNDNAIHGDNTPTQSIPRTDTLIARLEMDAPNDLCNVLIGL